MKGFSYLLLLSLTVLLLSGCSFRMSGITISPDIKTYFVGNYKLYAGNAPATIPQTFQEALKDKVSRESRLQFTNLDPDIEFNGAIQTFTVSAVAPKPDEQTSFNRLTIFVEVEYANHLDTKDQWKRTFSHFADFPTNQNLLDVQEELITIIFNQILEDIFNQAFNNW